MGLPMDAMESTGFRTGHLLSLAVVLGLLYAPTWTKAEESPPAWWPILEREAVHGGYTLCSYSDLSAFLADPKPFLLVDTRTAYEYRRGHIPGAIHFEFDLSNRSQLDSERRKALLRLLGRDKSRIIIFYCRNFR